MGSYERQMELADKLYTALDEAQASLKAADDLAKILSDMQAAAEVCKDSDEPEAHEILDTLNRIGGIGEELESELRVANVIVANHANFHEGKDNALLRQTAGAVIRALEPIEEILTDAGGVVLDIDRRQWEFEAAGKYETRIADTMSKATEIVRIYSTASNNCANCIVKMEEVQQDSLT